MIYGPHKSSGCGNDIMRQDDYKFNFHSLNDYPRNETWKQKISGCWNGMLKWETTCFERVCNTLFHITLSLIINKFSLMFGSRIIQVTAIRKFAKFCNILMNDIRSKHINIAYSCMSKSLSPFMHLFTTDQNKHDIMKFFFFHNYLNVFLKKKKENFYLDINL